MPSSFISEYNKLRNQCDYSELSVIALLSKNNKVSKVNNITSDVGKTILALGDGGAFDINKQLANRGLEEISKLHSNLKNLSANINSYIKNRNWKQHFKDIFISQRFITLYRLQKNLPKILAIIETKPEMKGQLNKIAKKESNDKIISINQKKIKKLKAVIQELDAAIKIDEQKPEKAVQAQSELDAEAIDKSDAAQAAPDESSAVKATPLENVRSFSQIASEMRANLEAMTKKAPIEIPKYCSKKGSGAIKHAEKLRCIEESISQLKTLIKHHEDVQKKQKLNEPAAINMNNPDPLYRKAKKHFKKLNEIKNQLLKGDNVDIRDYGWDQANKKKIDVITYLNNKITEQEDAKKKYRENTTDLDKLLHKKTRGHKSG
jgi:hypothetical protein